MDAADVRQGLLDALPSGFSQVLDLDDPEGPGPLLLGLAEVLLDHGVTPAEALRREANPATATENLPTWEGTLGLERSTIALRGDVAQRRAQLLSRLREFGATTRENAQQIVGLLLDYADVSQLKVLEVDRAVLRAAHTRTWTGSANFTAVPLTVAWTVADTAQVSAAGAQVDVQIDHPDVGVVLVKLTAPDGASATTQGIGRGAAAMSLYRLYFPSLRGRQVGGAWQLEISASSGTGTLSKADLFVEGFGRDPAGFDGLGSAKFFWGPVAEPNLLGPKADLEAARLAVRRINFATRKGNLLLRSSGTGALPAGSFAAIPDDPGAIPDACIPG